MQFAASRSLRPWRLLSATLVMLLLFGAAAAVYGQRGGSGGFGGFGGALGSDVAVPNVRVLESIDQGDERLEEIRTKSSRHLARR